MYMKNERDSIIFEMISAKMTNNVIIHNSLEYWDYRLSWASAAFFVGSAVNASIKTILPIPESLWGGVSAIVGVVILITIGKCFKELLRRSSKIILRSVFFFLGLYLLSAFLIVLGGYPLGQMIVGTAFLTYAWWIPSGVCACSVYDKSILYSVWVKASYIISFFSILMYFFYIPPETNNGSTQYNMVFGFNIILPLLIQINEFIREKRWWLLILILFEVFTVIVYANRGVLLSLVFFSVYKFAFESNNRLRKVISVLFLIVFTIIMLSSIQSIAIIAVEFLGAFGIDSRSLNMLAAGVVSDTSGRDEIWEICFKMIKERPVLGWGLGGEYFEIGRLLEGVKPENVLARDFNPHNGIIQNFVCFGVVGGLVANLFVIIPLLNLKRRKNKYTYSMILIFVSASIIPICISSSGFFVKPGVAVALYLFYFSNDFSECKYSVTNR